MSPSPRRRRRKPRVWGWLPDRNETAKILLFLGALGAWWDARHNPDQQARETNAGVAAYAVQLEERVSTLAERMGNAEGRLAGLEKRSGAPPAKRHSGPVQPRTQEKGWRGFLSRWLGNSD